MAAALRKIQDGGVCEPKPTRRRISETKEVEKVCLTLIHHVTKRPFVDQNRFFSSKATL